MFHRILFKNKALANWVAHIHNEYRRSKLNQRYIDVLIEMGFVWIIHAKNVEIEKMPTDTIVSLDPLYFGLSFVKRIKEMREYMNMNGTCVVCRHMNIFLANFVKEMREQYKENQLN